MRDVRCAFIATFVFAFTIRQVNVCVCVCVFYERVNERGSVTHHVPREAKKTLAFSSHFVVKNSPWIAEHLTDEKKWLPGFVFFCKLFLPGVS